MQTATVTAKDVMHLVASARMINIEVNLHMHLELGFVSIALTNPEHNVHLSRTLTRKEAETLLMYFDSGMFMVEEEDVTRNQFVDSLLALDSVR